MCGASYLSSELSASCGAEHCDHKVQLGFGTMVTLSIIVVFAGAWLSGTQLLCIRDTTNAGNAKVILQVKQITSRLNSPVQ